MTKPQWSRLFTLSGAALLAVSLVLGLMPSPAGSATSQVFTARAEGEAVQVRLAGADLVVPGPRVADTTQDPVEQGPTTGDLVDLPLLADLVAAGVFGQDAAVDSLGHSAACAGLVASGGQINVSSVEPPVCTVDVPAGPAGAVINLTSLGLFRLRLDAAYGECAADSSGATSGAARLVDAALDAGVNLPIFGPVFVPILTLPSSSPPNSQIPTPLGALLRITLNEQPVPQEPGKIELTALHVEVLPGEPDPLVDIEIGRVECGRNTVATAEIDFDTSGDLGGDTVQPQTENAFRMSYNSAVARPAVSLVGRVNIDGDLNVPEADLPADCTRSLDATTNPDSWVIVCPVGAVQAGVPVTRVIPVEILAGASTPIAATMQVFGGSLAEILSNPLTEEETLLVESTDVSGAVGGLAVPSPNRTGLPNDIVGTLRISTPPYVAEAAYGGTPCAVEAGFNPPASVYPAIPGNKIFNCGSSIAPPSVAALSFRYDGTAPVTGDGDPQLGRVLIIRGGQGPNPQERVGNSYYANLRFFVTPAAATTTSTSTSTSTTAASTTTTTTAPGATTTTSTTTPGATTTSTTAASTTTSTAPATTTTTVAATTTSTAPAATTTSTAAASTTSSTAAASTTSSIKAAIATTTTKAALAKTGSNSTTTAAIAMGLLGVGMVITGRGMQVEANGLDRRRRRR